MIYNCSEYTFHTGTDPLKINNMNNFYKDGPSTTESCTQTVFHFGKDDVDQRLYLSGNYVFGNEEKSLDNWKAVKYEYTGPSIEKTVRADKAFDTPYVTTQSALEAYEAVLNDAGCALPSRDQIDLRIVTDVRNGSGAVIGKEIDLPEGQRQLIYYSLPAPVDSDSDGMPDYWEEQYGLDRFDPSDNMKDSDGEIYVNIEEYMNNTVPQGLEKPVVYVASSDSKAYSGDGNTGEWKIMRTGSTDSDLTVNFTIGGNAEAGIDYFAISGTAVIPAGSSYTTIFLQPVQKSVAAEDRMVVLTVSADESYYSGCPAQSLVVICSGNAPF